MEQHQGWSGTSGASEGNEGEEDAPSLRRAGRPHVLTCPAVLVRNREMENLSWEQTHQKALGNFKTAENKVLQWEVAEKVKHKCCHLHFLQHKVQDVRRGPPRVQQIHSPLKAPKCSTDGGTETAFGKQSHVQNSEMEQPHVFWMDVVVKTLFYCSGSGG